MSCRLLPKRKKVWAATQAEAESGATDPSRPGPAFMTPETTAKAIELAMPAHYLCEFYFFRSPVLRRGFQPAQGGLLENAATLYPEAWAYLQTSEGKMLCKTEEEWQAMTQATWATQANGTKVGWNGIGGAPFYAPNWETGALRLPDLRGMYAEASGFDSLGVGGVHGDAVRPVTGKLGVSVSVRYFTLANGCFYGSEATGTRRVADTQSTEYPYAHGIFDISRVSPTANKNQPRAWGALACVYLGIPK